MPGFASRAFAKPADPISLVGWPFAPQIVEENIGIFSKFYDENVKYELVPAPYHETVETKKLGGQHIDVMYSEESHIVRWNRAGWTRDLEGLPGLDTIRSKMYDVNVHNMSLPNGKLAGLPYYTDFNTLFVNQKHLDAAKLEPPTTWDVFLEHCRKLKKAVFQNILMCRP